jgi:hypothetical protein
MRDATHQFVCIVLYWAAAVIVATAPLACGQAAHPAGNDGGQQPSIMRFKKFVIRDDPSYTGMVVTQGIMPADWTLKGGLVWNLADARPAQFRIHFGDAKDVSAFDIYPNHFFYWSRLAAQRGVAADQRYMGAIIEAPPGDAFEALAQVVVRRDRPDLAQAKVVEQTALKDVAAAAFEAMPKMAGIQYSAGAGKVTFEYELAGQTVQEEFDLVCKSSVNPRLGIMDWSVENVSSTRGPKGTLPQLNAVRAVMAHACQPNIQWYTWITNFVVRRSQATIQQLNEQEQRREIRMNTQQEINDQEKQQFQQHMDDIDHQSDAYADYMREVSPWKTDDGSTVKLPSQYGYAWEGADGQIIMNNDPRYNPASDPNNTPTQWTSMQQVK